jgi:hydrogenase maturation protease
VKEWTDELRDFLSAVGPQQLVLLGVGNPVKHDDSVGLYIADQLKRGLRDRRSASVRVLSAASYPELALARINLQSSRTLIFDAVETGKPAGSVVFAGIGETKYGFFATHNLPLKLHPLVRENAENVFILGVQPEDLEVGEGLSDTVRSAAGAVVDAIASQLNGGAAAIG